MEHKDNKIAIVCFYQVYPVYHGAAYISSLVLKYLPLVKKKLFQFHDLRAKKNNYSGAVISTNIYFNHALFKITFFPVLIFKILKYFKKSENKIIIIEGASWIFFSYLLIIIIKFFDNKIKFIYHSHNIEFEVRKLKNNFLISKITFFLENKVINECDISTSVCYEDYIKIKKWFKLKTVILRNGVDKYKIDKNFKKKLPKKYILYSGSYSYDPNKKAIDLIFSKYYKVIFSLLNDYYLVFTGDAFPDRYKFKNVKFYKKLNSYRYFTLVKNCKFLFLPSTNSPGTKLKIIEALSYGKIILSNIIKIKA